MPEWLQALRLLGIDGRPSILITVAATQGSAPRAPGARMVVAPKGNDGPGGRIGIRDGHNTFDTIGGGHLEWRATKIAQTLLDMPEAMEGPQLHRFPLGAALGQCCGGAVQLLFEKIGTDAQATAMVAALLQAWEQSRDVWRVLPLEAGGRAAILSTDFSGDLLAFIPAALRSGMAITTLIGRTGSGLPCVYDRCFGLRPQILLFGAGHVGRALATLLGTLRCRLWWIDQRRDAFPAALPANATIEASEYPEDIVERAAAGSYYLVMTHKHATDQKLSECILRRGDAAWFGLIGSATKRHLFLQRLAQRGLSEQQLAGMTCPIGIDGISGKAPASIAVAVAAQLLQLWENTLT